MRAGGSAGHMHDGGSIVNVASETAFTGSHGFAHYVASKGAVVSLTRALANELGRTRHPRQLRRPRVHADAGIGRARRVRPDAHARSAGSWQPSDLLGTFCYLLSDDSAFVSGQTILVNGGRVPH